MNNLYQIASMVIAPQTITYYKYKDRELNDVGIDVTTYETPVDVKANVQAVPRRIYEQYGLDLQKNYVMIYSDINFLDIGRDVSGDKIVYGGQTFQDLSLTDWFLQNGWVSVLAVQVDR